MQRRLWGAISPSGKFPVTWAHRTDHTHDSGRSWGDESSTIAYTRRHRIDFWRSVFSHSPLISFFCGQLVVRTFQFFRRTCSNSSCQPRWKLQLELDVGSGSALCVTISNTPDSESTGGTTSARHEARVIKRMWTRRWQERGRPPKKRRTCTCVSERRVTVGKAKKFIGLHTDSLFRQQSAEIRLEETRTCFHFVFETTGRGQYPLRSLALWKSKKMFVGSSFDHSTSPKMAALASTSTRKGFSSWRT